MIYIGTSGYSYDDWIGKFYPSYIKKPDFLIYYSKHFNACELNFSYYKMPESYMLQKIYEKSEGSVKFAVKLFQGFTHEKNSFEIIKELSGKFIEGIKPLRKNGVLGPILAQFPYSFSKNKENIDRIANLSGLFSEFDLVVEFRNKWWFSGEIYNFLRERKIGICCVDEPDLPGLPARIKIHTSKTAYVRFHGRNKEKWFVNKQAYERYDYRYNKEELAEWIPDLKRMDEECDNTYVFMNNHFLGQAVDNAKDIARIFHQNIYCGQ